MKNFTEYILTIAGLILMLLPISMAIFMIVVGIMEDLNIIVTLLAAIGIYTFATPISYYGMKALIDISNRLY